jgi:hypothetical protein
MRSIAPMDLSTLCPHLRMPILRRTRTLVLALLATLAACGDGPSDPSVELEPGTFEIEVSGDTAFSLTGIAGYRRGNQMLLATLNSSQGDEFQFFVGVPVDPQERRYDSMELGGGTIFIARQGTIRRQFAVAGGTLDIDEVTAETVAGTLEMTADTYDLTGNRIPNRVVTLRATFNAVRAAF